jgi:hypothetical protein
MFIANSLVLLQDRQLEEQEVGRKGLGVARAWGCHDLEAELSPGRTPGSLETVNLPADAAAQFLPPLTARVPM